MERTGISSNRSWSDVAYSRAVRFGDLSELLHPDLMIEIEATAIVGGTR